MNVKELEAQLAAAKKAQHIAGQEARKTMFEKIKGQFHWTVGWVDKYTMTVSKRYTDEAVALVEKMGVDYPDHCYLTQDQRGWMGMTYMLIGNVLVQSSGGWIVLKIERTLFRTWAEITDEQVACFHAGIVPEELKVI